MAFYADRVNHLGGSESMPGESRYPFHRRRDAQLPEFTITRPLSPLTMTLGESPTTKLSSRISVDPPRLQAEAKPTNSPANKIIIFNFIPMAEFLL